MIEHWGDSADGSKIYRVSIADTQLSAKVISFGACLQDLRFAGCDYPLVLGYDLCAPYLRNERYFGASVGRFANRIAHGRANLGDKVVTLDQNAGPHHLHGTLRIGFIAKVYQQRTQSAFLQGAGELIEHRQKNWVVKVV